MNEGSGPLNQVERTLSRFVVLSNYEQFVAGRSIVTGLNIAHLAIADV
jgi:hypothetical protein